MATWLESDNLGGWSKGEQRSIDLPVPTIMADGIAGESKGHWHWMRDNRPTSPRPPETKPPYSVPTMAEIAAVRGSNGYQVVSTFSGCGGSCLGFEMAGFEVAWASEFVPAAQRVYRLNHPGVHLDDRDIRTVSADDILQQIGLAAGELDVFEGSPPCASFSTAGRGSKGWGKVRKYSDREQRVDDLFFEYSRLLRGLRPRVFVAENVAGLARGVAKGYFLEILAELKACGYCVKVAQLDAQWLGVPQSRKRLIFMGVREDLAAEPRFPAPLPYRYSIRDALPWLCSVTTDSGGSFSVVRRSADEPLNTVTVENGSHMVVEAEAWMDGFAIGKEWERLKPGQQSERYFSLIRPSLDAPCPTVTQTAGAVRGAAGVTHPVERRKFALGELRRLCGFPDDFQLPGSWSEGWERLGRAVPPVMMFHVARSVREILDRCAASPAATA